MTCLPCGIIPFGIPGKPNCWKNFCIGEPGGNGLLPSLWPTPFVLVDCSILTRTEMTAGFTFATRSAKLAGAVATSAACAADTGAKSMARNVAGPPAIIAMPRPATDARSATRRAVRTFGLLELCGLL